MEENPTNAYVLRIAPANVDQLSEAIKHEDLLIGWDCGPELLDLKNSWNKFRKRVRDLQFPNEANYRRSSSAAGSLWRFIVEMQEGDLVAIPHGPTFYISEVAGPVRYYEPGSKDNTDTAYRRKMNLQNSGQQIPRVWARSRLQARLKARQTCVYATDLIGDLREVLEAATKGKPPSFAKDLRRKLTQETLHEIRGGRMNPDALEDLVRGILLALGAEEARIVPRRVDKGADVVAKFRIAGTFLETLAVQVKYHDPSAPDGPGVVDQLVHGMEAEEADLGWAVTSGSFSDEAFEHAKRQEDEKGIDIQLIDGEQLAAMVVETGVQWESESGQER